MGGNGMGIAVRCGFKKQKYQLKQKLNMETKLEIKDVPRNDGNTMLYAVSSDLYRTARKSDGGWEEEGVCRNCAIAIKDNPNSELKAYYDIHATRSFEAGVDVDGNCQGYDDFNEDYGIEYCTMCSEVIPRGGENWVDFEVPDDFERC